MELIPKELARKTADIFWYFGIGLGIVFGIIIGTNVIGISEYLSIPKILSVLFTFSTIFIGVIIMGLAVRQLENITRKRVLRKCHENA